MHSVLPCANCQEQSRRIRLRYLLEFVPDSTGILAKSLPCVAVEGWAWLFGGNYFFP
jgi:hypothetical protein